MAVNESGHENHALPVDDLLRLFFGSLPGQVADLALCYADKGGEQNTQLLVHGDYSHVRK
jgi:hypothetical protein